MFSFFKKKEANQTSVLFSPVSGKAVDLSEVPDQVFASKMMGEGIAFDFDGEVVAAPCDSKVMLVANTLHAVGLVMDNGAEILIHIGLDTTELNGEGFKALVSPGEKVKKGQPLISFDRAFIKGKGYSLVTPMVVTNSSEFAVEVLDDLDNVEEKNTPVIKFG